MIHFALDFPKIKKKKKSRLLQTKLKKYCELITEQNKTKQNRLESAASCSKLSSTEKIPSVSVESGVITILE